MNHLIRSSRNIFFNFPLMISRSSATTSSSSGGSNVRSSGASTNLSQTSRAADGTDQAMRDAQQRTNQTKSNDSSKKSEASSYAQIVLAVVLSAGLFYMYKNYRNSSDMAKTVNLNQEKLNKKHD